MSKVSFCVGDLLKCDAKMIVQQCNCVTTKAKGLSESISKLYPYAFVYTKDVKRVPGTIVVASPEKDQVGPLVACLFSQIAPGKPGAWSKQYNIDAADDTKEKRLHYFKTCLLLLVDAIKEKEIKTVAFPYNIGCGLAGGAWTDYNAAIEEFAQLLPLDVCIIIVKM